MSNAALQGNWQMRLAVAVAVLLLVVALVTAGAWVRFQRGLGPADPSGNGDGQRFEVPRGASLARVVRDLDEQGLIRDPKAFRLLARWRDAERAIQAGEYHLSPTWDAERILGDLLEGRVQTYAVVIPEGLRARQIAKRFEEAGLCSAEDFLAVALDPKSAERFGVQGKTLEGYLFPETYQWPRGLSAEAMIETMVRQYTATWEELAAEAARQGRGMRFVVTLASIVEKETGVADERPRIASVFLNRIERGMRLESDPTTIYGIDNFDGNLRRVHLEDETNAWNTYRISGLPPSPIANPGRDALRAILFPEKSDYLFFVARGDGTHIFSKTYAEHNANVNRFQRRKR